MKNARTKQVGLFLSKADENRLDQEAQKLGIKKATLAYYLVMYGLNNIKESRAFMVKHEKQSKKIGLQESIKKLQAQLMELEQESN